MKNTVSLLVQSIFEIPKMLTANKAEAILNIPRHMISARVRSRKISCFKFYKKAIFLQEDIEDALNNKTI